MRIFRCDNNKGDRLMKASFFLCYLLHTPYYFLCFSLISNAQLPLICLQLLWGHTGWENTPTWPDALAPLPLYPTHAQVRVRVVGWWKIMYQNLMWCHCNLFYQMSPSKGESKLTHYCSETTEATNGLGELNEVPIMNAMIKFPPGAVTKPHLTSPHL